MFYGVCICQILNKDTTMTWASNRAYIFLFASDLYVNRIVSL